MLPGDELQRLVAVVQGVDQVLADDGAGQAAVVEGDRQPRVEPDRLAVVGDRLVVLALGEIGEAAVVVRRRPRWARA